MSYKLTCNLQSGPCDGMVVTKTGKSFPRYIRKAKGFRFHKYMLFSNTITVDKQNKTAEANYIYVNKEVSRQ